MPESLSIQDLPDPGGDRADFVSAARASSLPKRSVALDEDGCFDRAEVAGLDRHAWIDLVLSYTGCR